MATRPPRVISRQRQPTTGRGRIVRRPANAFVSRGTLAGIRRPAAPRPVTVPVPRAPTAAPVSPDPAGYSALPPDASYDMQIASLQRQRDNQLAGLTAGRTQTLLDYGFTEGPNGALAIDPNNPLSKAALMKRAFDQRRTGNTNQMAARGQLYSGALINAQDFTNRQQLESEDQMQKALLRFLAQNTAQRGEVGTGFELAAGEAYGDRVGRFQTSPLYDPAANLPAAPAWQGRPQKTVRGKRYYQGQSGKWIPY